MVPEGEPWSFSTSIIIVVGLVSASTSASRAEHPSVTASSVTSLLLAGYRRSGDSARSGAALLTFVFTVLTLSVLLGVVPVAATSGAAAVGAAVVACIVRTLGSLFSESSSRVYYPCQV
jgi:hypothetical protein